MWEQMPKNLRSTAKLRDQSNFFDSGLEVVFFRDASAEDRNLYQQREEAEVEHGIEGLAQEMEPVLLDGLSRLKNALEASANNVANYIYLVVPKDEEVTVILKKFRRLKDLIQAAPEGVGDQDRSLQKLVKVVKLDRNKADAWMTENGYANFDAIELNEEKWKQIMADYFGGFSKGYYVKEKGGGVLNEGEPFDTAIEIVRYVCGTNFNHGRRQELAAILTSKGLTLKKGGVVGKRLWKDPTSDKTQEVEWVCGEKTYIVKGASFN